MDSMKASLEVKDYSGAARARATSTWSASPTGSKPAAAVLRGRLAEALGQEKDALDAYRFAAGSARPPGRRRRQAARDAARGRSAARSAGDDVLKEFELLSMLWRGDTIELKTLYELSKHLCRDRRAMPTPSR